MSSYEDVFEGSVLEVVAPHPSLEFPAGYTGERAADWLSRLRGPTGDRRVAFFGAPFRSCVVLALNNDRHPDENLDFVLTIRFPAPDEDGPSPKPPSVLLSFLSHLQISYETSYISPSALSAPDTPNTARLSLPPPPRGSSMPRTKSNNLLPGHPSIFPPSTPHPIPAAAESDRQYVQSQGTPLVSAIWGESETRDTEQFALLWDASERCWLAVYKMTVLVLFMLTKVSDPLLCITVATTLRNKPLAVTPPRQTLVALIDAAGSRLAPPVKTNGFSVGHSSSESDDDDVLSGLQEVNLLEGLSAGPTFADAQRRLSLPSSRLGPNTRMHEFALGPPPSATSKTPVPYATGFASPPPTGGLPRSATLRKSFRKTLKTLSGFRVRMRTVFVPYFLLPQAANGSQARSGRQSKPARGDSDTDSDSDLDGDILQEQEQREAGNEEHTVVLSVEIENVFSEPHTPTTSPSYHFEVERADVTVGGTGARTSLVGWGSQGGDVFPLQIGPREQANLLYAVSFLRGPEVDEFSLARPPGLDGKAVSNDELQRAVSINITGRPYDDASGEVTYPTRPYPSKWNCVLDLSSSSITDKKRFSDPQENEFPELFVLPTPASPFPVTAPVQATRSLTPLSNRSSLVPLTAVAGSKRHTIGGFDGGPAASEYARMPKSPMNYQSSTSMLNPANQPPSAPSLSVSPSPSPTPTAVSSGQTLHIPPNRASYLPPSIALQTTFPRSPTTYGAPTSPPLPPPPAPSNMNPLAAFTHAPGDSISTISEILDPATPTPPRTPAYPAYPSSPAPVPPTPFWQTPVAQQSGAGAVGPSVEIRRERGGAGAGVPQTPGPTVGGFGALTGGGGFQAMQDAAYANMHANAHADRRASYFESGGGSSDGGAGEPIVVSVGLLSPHHNRPASAKKAGAGRLHPLDQFTLDIFVFNQSSWTRRLEVSYPEERRRRRKAAQRESMLKPRGEAHSPGIIPLENRVRIGPLLPSTCQSVRMDFLALTPGVHSIDTLTLTDIQTGFTMNLRSVIDIIVHEPERTDSAQS
ncbi:TRAPP trafficking subunit Trs65-domain-containing protein [Trametes elegans]|nr:TRAPP trafficking subunit Trs65-domain-containing protein [Trametes elegans]